MGTLSGQSMFARAALTASRGANVQVFARGANARCSMITPVFRPALQLRSFAAKAAPVNPGTAVTASRAALFAKRMQEMSSKERWAFIKNVAGWGTVALGGIVVFRIFTDTTSFLVNLTNYQVFTAGMATGAVGVGVVMLGGYTLRKALQIRPEPLYRHVLKFLKRDARVVESLGKELEPGKFRSYRYEGMNWMPNRKLQLMFDLNGNKHSGIVSVEVQRTFGKFNFDLLSVDVKGTGDRIVLSGDVNRALSNV